MISDHAIDSVSRLIPSVPQSDVAITPFAPDGVEGLLEDIVFGTSGLRYRRRQVAEQLMRFNDPTFIALRVADTLAGVYVLDKRQLICGNRPALGLYRGLLSVAENYQGKGIGKQLGEAAAAWINETASDATQPTLTFGFVEADNTRSRNMLHGFGHRAISEQVARLIYRQNPSLERPLTSISEIDANLELIGLELTHADCSLRDITSSPLPGYAITDSDGLRISARVSPVEIAPQTLGRAADWMVRLLVTPFAPARKRFDPRAFRYLKLTSIVLRPGCEADWHPFVGSLLHQYGLHFASVQLDVNSALLTRLQRIRGFTPWLRPADQRVLGVGRPVGDKAAELMTDYGGPHQLSAVDF